MVELKDFDIKVFNLTNKVHTFSFDLNEDFFTLFEGEINEKCDIHIEIDLDKRENLMELTLSLKGAFHLVSDRSLRAYDEEVDLNKKLLYKYGPEESELEDDVFVITKDTQTINPAQYLYETLALEIPLKKLHPDERENEDAEDEYIYLDDTSETENNDVDPRWEALKQLKNKK